MHNIRIAVCIHMFIHYFVPYGDLYSASSMLLLRSAPDPCTATKNSFQAGIECKYRKCQNKLWGAIEVPWKLVPCKWANRRECTGLPCGSTEQKAQRVPPVP